MKRSLFASLIFPTCLVFLAACSSHPRTKRAERAATKPAENAFPAWQVAGTIAVVNTAEAYVLVDCGGFAIPPAGTVLKSVGEGDSWEVRVSPIQKRPFVVADITKGMPEQGARAFRAVRPEDYARPGSEASALDQ